MQRPLKVTLHIRVPIKTLQNLQLVSEEWKKAYQTEISINALAVLFLERGLKHFPDFSFRKETTQNERTQPEDGGGGERETS
jgi:hypothetical protein